ncbi:hypothetical protein FQN53_008569 [Emmonsiellopsis sp. PD_33]|nr:hypothetical protein FQN53_008569 [Emmonsiellopsis sp. PD_33]
MTFLGISRPKASDPRRRSSPPTISPPLPFPPEYYVQNGPTPTWNPPVRPEPIKQDAFQQPPRSAPPRPVSRNSEYRLPVQFHPPAPVVEEHPAYRQPCHSLNASTFIPYSPSDYDVSRLSVLSSPDLPPTPPNSPPWSRPNSPAPSRNPSTSSWLSPSQAHSNHSTWRPPSMAVPITSGASTQVSYNSDTDPDQSSSGSVDLSEVISGKLDDVITSIDGRVFSGLEKDLLVTSSQHQPFLRGGDSASSSSGLSFRVRKRRSAATSSVNYFSKVYHYANSRLPPSLTPLRLYIPTYPLLCLAARFSQRVYSKPTGTERETRVEGDWKLGAKAMVIKSDPVDNMNVIVFAIRGTHSFRDWSTNMNSDPVAPDGFLEDRGNLCHAGFLSQARRMVKPVATRLQQILDENPSRTSCSLVITGHSAGGAIASLLFMHMLSRTLKSDLVAIRDCFKRVHCITFGAPPVTLLPLQKPVGERFQKWLFFSFINEGDPVPRADKSYVRSLVDLYISPAPPLPSDSSSSRQQKFHLLGGKDRRSKKSNADRDISDLPSVIWKTPPSVFSTAGNLILLRGRSENPHDKNYVEAGLLKDEDLRDVVFGDPMMHLMELYERRIEILATNAVTARGSLR